MRGRHRKRAAKAQSITTFTVIVLLVALVFVVIKIGAGALHESEGFDVVATSNPYKENAVQEVKAEEIASVSISTPTPEPIQLVYDDPDNYIYPYNTMSADWGGEIYEDGFRFYEIPEEYSREGGCFPEVVQVYLWSLCKEREIDYYTVVALIERESGYKYDAAGDGGKSKGYMQIGERWHKERMAEEGVEDLYNPYGNIRVGLNFLQSLSDRYLDNSGISCVLMAYNMGESTAKSFWADGVYSTAYTRGILARADEIKQAVQAIEQR